MNLMQVQHVLQTEILQKICKLLVKGNFAGAALTKTLPKLSMISLVRALCSLVMTSPRLPTWVSLMTTRVFKLNSPLTSSLSPPANILTKSSKPTLRTSLLLMKPLLSTRKSCFLLTPSSLFTKSKNHLKILKNMLIWQTNKASPIGHSLANSSMRR